MNFSNVDLLWFECQVSPKLFELGTALFSKDKQHRFLLGRDFRKPEIPGGRRPWLLYVLCNPSRAGAQQDDATIRRCRWFAHRENAAGFLVVNVSPYIATDPKDLKRRIKLGTDAGSNLTDVLMPNETDYILGRIDAEYDVSMVVLAWGAVLPKELAPRARVIAERFKGRLYAFGASSGGQPLHPVRLPNTAELRPVDCHSNGELVVWKSRYFRT